MESVNVWDKRALTAVQVVSSLSFFLGLGEKKKKKLSKAIHFYYYHVISSNFSSFYPSIPLHFLFDFSISKDLCFKINKCTSHFQSLFESSDLQELHGEAISTLGRQELHCLWPQTPTSWWTTRAFHPRQPLMPGNREFDFLVLKHFTLGLHSGAGK